MTTLEEKNVILPPPEETGFMWKSPTGKYIVLCNAVGTLEQGRVVTADEIVQDGQAQEAAIKRLLGIRAIRFANGFEAKLPKVNELGTNQVANHSIEQMIATVSDENRSLRAQIASKDHEIGELRKSLNVTAPPSDNLRQEMMARVAQLEGDLQAKETIAQNLQAQLAEAKGRASQQKK